MPNTKSGKDFEDRMAFSRYITNNSQLVLRGCDYTTVLYPECGVHFMYSTQRSFWTCAADVCPGVQQIATETQKALGIHKPVPDEAFVSLYNDNDTNNKSAKIGRIVIVEFKYQNVSGSVCNKIFAGDWYRQQYAKFLPMFDIEYIVVASGKYFQGNDARTDTIRVYLGGFGIKFWVVSDDNDGVSEYHRKLYSLLL